MVEYGLRQRDTLTLSIGSPVPSLGNIGMVTLPHWASVFSAQLRRLPDFWGLGGGTGTLILNANRLNA